MNTSIPSVGDIQARLAALPLAQLGRLAELSGVPLPTLTKIRYGQTVNPGIETVRLFMPHLAAVNGAQDLPPDGAPAVPAAPEPAKAA